MKRSHWLLGVGTSMVLVSPAAAQSASQPVTPAAGSAQKGLEEIVVTAQRREERLQDVPVSVTALGPAELARRQVVDINALTRNAPAITFSTTPYNKNDLVLSIRGVAPGGILPNVDQAVGLYVDGLYYARPEGSNFALVDLASAEVLRGPQGTLFGRNTIGGALNITTNKPTYDFNGSVKLGYGNYNELTATGIVNAPIIDDKLAVRLVYSHIQHDGFGYNPILNSYVDDQDDHFVRLSIRADPTEKVRIDLSGDYYHGENHQSDWVLAHYLPGTSPANLAPYVASGDTRTNLAGVNPLNRSYTYDLNGTVTVDLGTMTLKSISAYREIDYNGANDQDGTPLPNADVLLARFYGHQFSQELQLTGKALDDRLVWVAGAYYFREHINNSGISRTGATIADNVLIPTNQSVSGFGQLTYEVVPRVRITAGLRYAVDTRSITYHRPVTTILPAYTTNPNPPASGFGPTVCAFTALGLNQDPAGCTYRPAGHLTFKTVPWTFGIDFKPTDETLLYAKAAKGFRSGGYQQPTGATAAFFTPFKDENVMSYEGGAKLDLLDNHLRLSMAGYYSIYNDVQQNSLLPPPPGSALIIIAVVNAGKEKIYGGEFEATALLGRLRLNGALGLIHPKFVRGPYVGTPVPTVAKTTWNVSGDYPITVSSYGTLELHAGYSYMSKVNFFNTGSVNASGNLVPYSAFQAAAVTQKGYGLLDAQASFKLKSMPLTIGLYGRNLTNRYYAGRVGSLAGAQYNSIQLGDPRTYGLSLGYTF